MTYAQLAQHFERVFRLREVQAIIEWDQEVNMPVAAGAQRAAAVATLAVIEQELLTAPQVEAWLHQADQETLGPWERANLREARRIVMRSKALPPDLLSATLRAEKASELAWREARRNNDFAGYAPCLETVVERKREVASCLAEALGVTAYDALLDGFEPGARSAIIDPIFARLAAELPGLIDQVIERQASETLLVPEGPFPIAQQYALGVELMKAVGFDTARGRLDTSHHAFCGGVPGDVRITTRYNESDFFLSLLGVLHEAGHGKYEQGLPEAWLHQPVGQARGMVLHESQSLLQEMQVCRGPEFLHFAAPKFRTAFPESFARNGAAFSAENLVRYYTRVEKSYIRVDADEVTYPAHVLLRYELERQLIDGKLAVRDVPEAWNARMQQLLGLRTLGNDRDGCLQDIHWPAGLFGYFPLYTLGAMVAAQLFAKLTSALPDALPNVRHGDFSLINTWLKDNVWSKGSSLDTEALLVEVTGEGLNPDHFLSHLRRRYLGDTAA